MACHAAFGTDHLKALLASDAIRVASRRAEHRSKFAIGHPGDPKGVVLDMGRGEGVAIRMMAERLPRSRFVGVDIAAEAVATARADSVSTPVTFTSGVGVGHAAHVFATRELNQGQSCDHAFARLRCVSGALLLEQLP